MGTKNNPGQFDCYANAEPDEPMFILLGRDPMAASLVNLWGDMRLEHGEDAAKVAEAYLCAEAMRAWLKKLNKKEIYAPCGDTYGQVRAWTAVFELCKSLGMDTLSPEYTTGIERVLGFIRKLAEQPLTTSDGEAAPSQQMENHGQASNP